ncbi:murein hydrolase activator EnvC family protein [Paenactinomyces guangxiensis]|uniref:Peptidoglycan DD-metalloendopeptidase family protein n=1 Tax=Paenactinomyces guangxiensis TaxID=1490290 RepID=A0A7W2A9V1_9BACL|nr:peptidoglycan DD-metalloendopeptidase family protein [Paenactinomyces guangxiensis]MBA4495587.1 peptidoglycan DD-metalloendopeptidase family protein [Paenactinomyces guangxiensis]MBH8592845.1 peptidoglycan DD-metalloendopeptidase family protein [Paenactinomyces guangxiensis]
MKQKLVIGLTVACLAWSCFLPGTVLAEKKSLKEIQKDKASTKEDIKDVQARLNEKQKSIQAIEKEVDKYDKKIAELNKDLQKNEKQLAAQQKNFQEIVTKLYLKGEMGYMAKLVEANSFNDFLMRFELVRLKLKQDISIINNFKKTKHAYESDIKQLEEAKAKQSPLLEKAEKEVEALNKEYNKYKKEFAALEKEERAAMGYGGGGGILAFPSTPGYVSWNYGQDRGSHIHAGIDIPRPPGTPIYAAEDGVVIRSEPMSGYGWAIDIRHGNGLMTRYAHMYRSSVRVSVGQHVDRGQPIAGVGNNGRSYGARGGYHLHFEVHKNGSTRNPRQYLQ